MTREMLEHCVNNAAIKNLVHPDRLHRTAAQQRTAVLRDQKHFAAGLRPLRFTHWQVFKGPQYVAAYLTDFMRLVRGR
jgi:hypothetical protein